MDEMEKVKNMSITKNYIYNVIYQIIILIIPLITVPYISRILGSNGVGINAFTNSIVQYFILFGTIGISLYGNRTIAYVRDDIDKLSRTFWGITVLKFLTTLIALVIFFIFLCAVGQYKVIFLIQAINLVAAAIDISWLFMGLEDFKKTVVRNLLVRIIGVLCIFLFVRTYSDLWKYVLILGASQLFGQLTMWVYLPQTVKKIRLTWSDIFRHVKPSIYLFVPQIAIQIYVVMNKTMLGYLSNTNEVGFFDNSDKIVKMILAVVTATGVVMLPRVSNTFARGQFDKVKGYLYQSFDFASYLSIPIAFGLAATANTFTPWFFGPGFEKTGTLICMISPIVVFIAWSNVIGQQFLMPVGQLRGYTVSVTMGALVNFILNMLLIKQYQSVGTAIATDVAEFSVTLVQLLYVLHQIEVKKLFQSIWKYFLSGLIMYLLVSYIGFRLPDGFRTTVLQVITGILIYFILMFALRSEINRTVINKGVNLIRVRRKDK